MMKGLVYVILCHQHPYQLLRLIASIYHEQNTYLVHVDRNAPPAMKEFVRRLGGLFPNLVVLPSIPCTWGGWSLVQVVVSAIRFAAAANPQFSHLVMLSGVDLPLKSQPEIISTVQKLGERSSVSTSEVKPEDKERRLQNKVLEIPGEYLLHLRTRPQLPDFSFHKGSQWAILSRALCTFIAEGHAREFIEFFRHSLVPDEHFFPTLIASTPFASQNAKRHWHFIEWENGRPRTLGASDFFKAKTTRSLFARKFGNAPDAELESGLQQLAPAWSLPDAARQLDLPATASEQHVTALTALTGRLEHLLSELPELAGRNARFWKRMEKPGETESCQWCGVFLRTLPQLSLVVRCRHRSLFAVSLMARLEVAPRPGVHNLRKMLRTLPSPLREMVHPELPPGFGPWHHVLRPSTSLTGIVEDAEGVNFSAMKVVCAQFARHLVQFHDMLLRSAVEDAA